MSAPAIPSFPLVAFTVALVATMSRGAIQLIVGQTAAYAIQVGAVLIFVVALVMRGRVSTTRWFQSAASLGFLFLLVALLSMASSLAINGIDYGGTLVVVLTFFAVLLVLFSGLDFERRGVERAGFVLAILVWAQIGVAALQQVANYRVLPGTDAGTFRGQFIRPSGLTGSFLHYPITLALVAFLLLGIFAVRRKLLYLVTAIAAFGAVALSQSRSGIVLVIVGLGLGFVFSRSIAARLRLVIGIGFLIVLILAFFPNVDIIARVLSISNLSAGGNATRIDVWSTVLDLWSKSPLLIGSHTGAYTNVTSRLTDSANAGVAESGLLELLINFGVLGMISFYGLMVIAILSAPRRTWFQAGLLAGVIQSFFYQSIEVLPFMTIFALTPMLARMFEAEFRRRSDITPALGSGRR